MEKMDGVKIDENRNCRATFWGLTAPWLACYVHRTTDSGPPLPGVAIPSFHHSQGLPPLNLTLSLTLTLSLKFLKEKALNCVGQCIDCVLY